ncbi:DAPG hydrolase family protein [Pseudomonas sp. MHK4]|jgi:hypothetical protein
MELNQVSALLESTPMKLETGFERLESGVLHVACRTDMHGCSGEMFEWWFRSRPDTQRYIWWHPVDHVASHWIEGTADTHIGSIHLAEEYFSGLPSQKLAIQFRHPHEFFEPDGYERAKRDKRVSAAICARIAPEEGLSKRDNEGRLLGGRLLHIGRDTSWGLVLRSHFYLGQDLVSQGLGAETITEMVPEEFGQALLMHCYNEFTFLSRFLPSLYVSENRDKLSVGTPW